VSTSVTRICKDCDWNYWSYELSLGQLILHQVLKLCATSVAIAPYNTDANRPNGLSYLPLAIVANSGLLVFRPSAVGGAPCASQFPSPTELGIGMYASVGEWK
jgi:hypothetical protein